MRAHPHFTSGQLVTANGRNLNVRIDGGIPMRLLPTMCEQGALREHIEIPLHEEEHLITQKSHTSTNVTVPDAAVVVLCIAITIFLTMTAGIIAVVFWVQGELDRVTEDLAADGAPTLSQLIKHIGAILNHTETTALHVQDMAQESSGLLIRTVGVADHALNVSDDIVTRVAQFSKTPALTLLGGIG